MALTWVYLSFRWVLGSLLLPPDLRLSKHRICLIRADNMFDLYSNPCSLLLLQSLPCSGLLSFYSQSPPLSTSKFHTCPMKLVRQGLLEAHFSPFCVFTIPWRLIHTSVLTHDKSLLFSLNLHGHGLLPLRGHRWPSRRATALADLPSCQAHTSDQASISRLCSAKLPRMAKTRQTLPCSHKHTPSAELFHFPQLKPVPITHQLPVPAPPAPGAHHPAFCPCASDHSRDFT